MYHVNYQSRTNNCSRYLLNLKIDHSRRFESLRRNVSKLVLAISVEVVSLSYHLQIRVTGCLRSPEFPANLLGKSWTCWPSWSERPRLKIRKRSGLTCLIRTLEKIRKSSKHCWAEKIISKIQSIPAGIGQFYRGTIKVGLELKVQKLA